MINACICMVVNGPRVTDNQFMSPANKSPAQAAQAQALYRAAVAEMSAGRFAQSLPLLQKAFGLMPNSPEILNNLGTSYWKTGDTEKALQHYAKAVRLAPANALAQTNYGALLMELERLDDAEAHLKRAYALKPENPTIANHMGLMQCRRGDFAGAEASFHAAIKANPNWSEAHGNLGDVYRDTRRLSEAETEYRKALELDARNIRALAALGSLYTELQRNKEAEEALRKAVDLAPGDEKAWVLLLLLLEMTNRVDDAENVMQKAKAHFTRSPRLAAMEAKILRRRGKDAEALALLESYLPLPDSEWPGIHFFFELGQLYDEAGDADKAFAAFDRANALQAATPRAQAIDKSVHTAMAEQIRKFLTPAVAKTFPQALPEKSPSPVFLVGFPRSGTTLLDQILSSHPAIYVGDEKPAVTTMISQLKKRFGAGKEPAYPFAIPQLAPADIAELRNVFYREHGGDAALKGRLLVDKMPVNLMHAAFIHAVFPESKFILALRHPCDCVLSAYMQAFALNTAMARFNDLSDAARFYDEMFGVWEQTLKVLPLTVHTIRYEDVVADFRPTVAALLSFLGLEWTDAVLEFDRTAKAKERINTASYAQVTQKLYTRASGRWLRYRRHLESVLEILHPYAERYGYGIDKN
jgi:tetratricopeptide (TPR) repeat protein